MSKPVAIIMLARNSGTHLGQAVMAILENTQHPFKLIIIESESTDGTMEFVKNLARKHSDIEAVHTKREGVPKAWNVGIEAAKDLDIYLTHDDVIHPNLYNRDWLGELVRISQTPKCGAVMTMDAGGVSGPTYLNGLRWAGTWSLFIPRDTIKKIGTFDEKFSPGNGEDIDYSYRILKAGLTILEAPFWVDHHHMTEHSNDDRPDVEELKNKNAQYFRRKFGLEVI